MKSYFTYKYALFLGIFLIIGSLSACSLGRVSKPLPTPSVTKVAETFTKAPTPVASTLAIPTEKPTIPLIVKDSTVEYEATLSVRGTSISLGDSKDSLIKKLGRPSRVVDTEYDFDYYIYNNDYKKLVFVAVNGNKIVGFYTDSLDFTFLGFSYGADISTVNHFLAEDFSLTEVLTHNNDTYTLKVLVDKVGNQSVVGVYVLANTVKETSYSDLVIKNIELLMFDLTNSIRARNNLPVLTWSSTVTISSRKHSNNMAENDFFDHFNPEGQNPGDRLTAVGILYSTIGENIIAGYGSSILSNHAWYNSTEHRKNMLSTKFRYLGIGFAYQEDSVYKTYITQDYYK